MGIYLFIDTNIYSQTTNDANASLFLSLHKLNEEFYKDCKVCLLSQVYKEITHHNENLNQGIGELVHLEVYNDIPDYFFKLFRDLIDFIAKVGKIYSNITSALKSGIKMNEITKQKAIKKAKDIEHIISDGYFYLSSVEDILIREWVIILYEYIITLGINPNISKTTNDTSYALASILENTKFGEKPYYGLTYRDVNRIIGNFAHEYKNYKLKGAKQQTKVGKDCIVLSDIIVTINKRKINIDDNNMVFVTSDYSFIKELKRFFSDIQDGITDRDDNYYGLSQNLIQSIKILSTSLKIIKLDTEGIIFENSNGAKSKYLIDLI